MAAEPPLAWSPAQRRLHWTIAALVALTALAGLAMVAVPFAALLAKFLLYQVHKSLGLVVFGCAVALIALRLIRGRPPGEAAIPRWQHRAALAVQATLFALLLLVPLSGWLAASAAPAAVPTLLFGIVPVPHLLAPSDALYGQLRLIHLALVSAFGMLVLGHAAAALSHHWRGRNVLRRMWRG
ncbi:MAG: cytochrome b/b6 domain-containing protein [Acetobacteraceae bacterium]|nr:cytochrome b/b6 domain-containing protein [Acetobacteraceae bacterium]